MVGNPRYDQIFFKFYVCLLKENMRNTLLTHKKFFPLHTKKVQNQFYQSFNVIRISKPSKKLERNKQRKFHYLI